MIVVSDTSPLTALLTVGEVNILQKLFHEVVIPEAVQRELKRGHQQLPHWIRVQSVSDHAKVIRFAQSVDLGEAEAITLATELHADHLLIDERKGRRLALQERLPIVGLLGVVLMAKNCSLIVSARQLLDRLDNEAGIYLSNEIREKALKTVGE